MNSITLDTKYRQSLITYAQKYGVSHASRGAGNSRLSVHDAKTENMG